MHCRFGPLKVLAALLGTCLLAGTTQAHGLSVQAFALPNNQVQIESWFSTGRPARGARVEVFRSGRQPVTSGQLDEQGIFVFPCAESEPLTVVVSAAGGHRAEIAITTEELRRARQDPVARPSQTSADADDPPAAVLLARRDASPIIKDALIGLSFLLALAAFLLSVRTARRLRELRSRL
jgi:hypothetical protein